MAKRIETLLIELTAAGTVADFHGIPYYFPPKFSQELETIAGTKIAIFFYPKENKCSKEIIHLHTFSTKKR